MSNDTLILAVVFVTAFLAVGGVSFVLVTPSNKEKVNKRVANVAKAGQAQGGRGPSGDTQRDRRKQVQDTLKQLEESQKERKQKVTLRGSIEQAGLEITIRTFYIFSAVAGFIGFFIGLVSGQQLLISALMAVAAGLGLPRWVLNYLRNKRQKKFSEEFSNAIDVIVRGVKSGLPVAECMKVIASESPPPVCEEFQNLVEGARIGLTLEQSLHRMFERMPLPEVNFFAIVLIIQQKTGGNLAEALGNLAEVLRSRKRLKGKIEALSSEAKASAMIIGALPFFVMGALYLFSPDYLMVLFTTKVGNLMLMGGGGWMMIGVLIMRGMINFKV
ncbi:MAG: type II secretion system F family protein [Pseudomonadota bacterium]